MDVYIKRMKTVRSFTNVIANLRDVNLRPTRQRIALAKMLFDGDNRHITAENRKHISCNNCSKHGRPLEMPIA